MTLTREQLQNLRDAIDAHLREESVECRHLGGIGDWQPCVDPPCWTTEYFEYRPAPKPLVGWVNIYKDDGGRLYLSGTRVHMTRAGADHCAAEGCVSCIKVTEGQFDD